MDHRQQSNNNNNNNVEDLTHRLDQMNVGMLDQQQQQYFGSNQVSQQHNADTPRVYSHEDQRMSIDEENIQPYDENDDDDTLANRQSETFHCHHNSSNSQETSGSNNEDTQILIVTQLDPRVFTDSSLRDKFESLVKQYDEQVTFRYLKSFRRIRLDFTSSKRAEQARLNLNNQQLGNSSFRCYPAQIIRPNFQQNTHISDLIDHDPRIQHQHQQDGSSPSLQPTGYLNIPKLTRQHLISPPMSPPVDWVPKEESTPCIDVQLLSAIANLVPGQTHEIHAGNESQPGIYVEVCEEPHFDTISELSCRHQRLPKTMIPPGTPRPEPRNDNGNEVNTDICKMES